MRIAEVSCREYDVAETGTNAITPSDTKGSAILASPFVLQIANFILITHPNLMSWNKILTSVRAIVMIMGSTKKPGRRGRPLEVLEGSMYETTQV
jgi:hypothetical protein